MDLTSNCREKIIWRKWGEFGGNFLNRLLLEEEVIDDILFLPFDILLDTLIEIIAPLLDQSKEWVETWLEWRERRLKGESPGDRERFVYHLAYLKMTNCVGVDDAAWFCAWVEIHAQRFANGTYEELCGEENLLYAIECIIRAGHKDLLYSAIKDVRGKRIDGGKL